MTLLKLRTTKLWIFMRPTYLMAAVKLVILYFNWACCTNPLLPMRIGFLSDQCAVQAQETAHARQIRRSL